MGLFPRAPAVTLLAILVGACAYPTRNQPAEQINDSIGYRWENVTPDDADDTLVIVTASGGGTRAAALTLSVLQGLHKIILPNGRSLAEEVDLISSVSGGSVTAAYFALRGPEGFTTLRTDFIDQDGIGALLRGGLNPLVLGQLATPGTERIDLLIRYFDRQLFKGATYQTLIDRKRRPFLLLNAADMAEGVPFGFTQRKFDLLCSDLSKMDLATGVAASAAFPVALSPVTLVNYQKCPAVKGIPWPPHWLDAARGALPDPAAARQAWYNNPQRVMVGRTELSYALGKNERTPPPKSYIHLLDGGIADNLGIFEPYRMLTTSDSDAPLFGDIDAGRITKLVFVMINARSFKSSKLDQSAATPGFLDMLTASIDSSVDRNTAGMASQLRELLREQFRQMTLPSPENAQRFHRFAQNTTLISVDFDAITDDACRRKFQGIATSWTLEKGEIAGLIEVGAALLANDPEFEKLLKITGARRPDLPDLDKLCANLPF